MKTRSRKTRSRVLVGVAIALLSLSLIGYLKGRGAVRAPDYLQQTALSRIGVFERSGQFYFAYPESDTRPLLLYDISTGRVSAENPRAILMAQNMYDPQQIDLFFLEDTYISRVAFYFGTTLMGLKAADLLHDPGKTIRAIKSAGKWRTRVVIASVVGGLATYELGYYCAVHSQTPAYDSPQVVNILRDQHVWKEHEVDIWARCWVRLSEIVEGMPDGAKKNDLKQRLDALYKLAAHKYRSSDDKLDSTDLRALADMISEVKPEYQRFMARKQLPITIWIWGGYAILAVLVLIGFYWLWAHRRT